MTDVLIIGGGPGGYTAALEASKNGLSVILFEKDKIGGTCLNRGCIPTKSLIRSAEVCDLLKEGELYGVRAEGAFDFPSAAKRRDDIVDSLRSGIEKALKSNKVTVVSGEAKLIREGLVSCNGVEYEGEHVIIASGSRASLPPIEGREYAVTSDELLIETEKFPKSMVIIGGGVIGVEIAGAYASFGTEVTILEMADRILPLLEREVSQRLTMFLKKKGIRVLTGVTVKKISGTDEGKSVTYTDAKGNETVIETGEVLLAAGRRACTENIADTGTGLLIRRGIVTDEYLQSNLSNVYAIGDVREGSAQLAHAAIAEALCVIDHILGKERNIDRTLVPSCIYSSPEIATVGISEEEAKRREIPYETKKVLTGANGKSLIENSPSGYVKLVLSDRVIIGASIIAPHATELISELTLAISKKMTAEDVSSIIHPHPTVSEMIGESVQ